VKTIKLEGFRAIIGTDELEFYDENSIYHISPDCDWLINGLNTTREDALYQLLSCVGEIEVQLIDGQFCYELHYFEYDEINILINRNEEEGDNEFTESLKLHEPE
jgi:hypothetical protein